MFNVSFNVGVSRTALARATALLEDMTPVYQDIGEYLVEKRRQRFINGTDPDGKAWAPKSAATLERYKQLGYGTLTRPLIGPGKRLSREIQQFVSRNGVIVGSSLAYAGVMQDGAEKGAFGRTSRGAPIPWGRIPARRWIDLNTEEGTEIVEITEDHLAETLNGQG